MYFGKTKFQPPEDRDCNLLVQYSPVLTCLLLQVFQIDTIPGPRALEIPTIHNSVVAKNDFHEE